MQGSFLARFKVEGTQTLKLAVPVIIGQWCFMFMHLADVVIVGHYGTRQLGGMGLGGTLSSIAYLVSLGVLSAAGASVSQAHGAHDKKACGTVLGQAIWLAMAISLLMVAGAPFVESVLLWIGQAPELSSMAQAYVTPLSLGFPAALGFLAQRQFVEGMSLTRPAMFIAIAGLALNVPLNLLLMFGYFGLPALGVAGTGLATAISQWVMFGFLSAYIWHGQRFRDYHVLSFFRGPRWPEIRRLLSVGLPLAISAGMEVGIFGGVSLLMGWFGPTALAAHQIAINLCSFTFMMPLGIGIAGSIRVGQARGRKSRHDIRWAGWTTFVLAILVMACTSLLLVTIPHQIVGLYTEDPEVIQAGVALLMIGAVFQIFDGIQVAGINVLRGLKDTRVPMLANIAAYWLAGFSVAWWLGVSLGHGPTGLWWGLVCGLAVAAFSHTIRFWWRSRG